VRPGTDLLLLNAMLCTIADDGLLDEPFIARHTSGFAEALATAREWPPERAAEVCGVPAEDIVRAARLFGSADAAMALWSMGANQSTVGTLKNRALINLCLATGNLGRPGCGPLSLTGQPNAMGGREVGGLAHLLPGYRTVADAEDRAEMAAHWGVPVERLSAQPGLTATEIVDGLLDGRVRAVLVAATNPIVSMPDGGRVREAFERAELVVVQDCHHPTETSALAHAVLPAAAWPEKEGTMTNSERRVGLVRRLLDPPGEALPDWQIYARLAHALGYGEGFAWTSSAEVYDEFAAITAGRPCDVSGLSHERLRREGSVQWPAPAMPEHDGTPRLYADRRVHTPDGRARFAPTPHAAPAEVPDDEWPLLLTTGRLADQWHTMTRTGKSPLLRAAAGAPTLDLHPDDARAAGLAAGDLARVRSRRGEALLTVALDATLPAGVAFAPFHFGALHAPPGAGTLNATAHAAVDPTSKQPELKAIAVRLEPARTAPAARTASASRGPRRRQLVIVGSGMAGLTVAEEVLRRDDGWRITLLGEETGPTYNRIMIGNLLSGEAGPGELLLRPRAWYEQHEVDLRDGCAAVAIDTAARTVTDEGGETHRYDALVVATGSRAFVPPIAGAGLPHVHVFRTRADVEAIEAALARSRRSVVIGGGLLGLEAAAQLRARGQDVAVVEPAPRLMGRQLDEDAAAMLTAALARQGIAAHVGRGVHEIAPAAVLLDDGTALDADLVVVAAGVRPETQLARAAGLPVAHGIEVDDTLRTAVAGVWAVGECAEHRGTVYGLWAPLAEQARVAGATIAGDPAAFRPLVPATTLKVAGVDLYAGGRVAAEPGEDEVVLRDTRRGRYRKLIVRDDQLVGAILLGDVGEARHCSSALRGELAVDEAFLIPAGAAGAAAPPAPDAVVCSCNQVTVQEIDDAIRARGLTSVAQIANATRASTGCGGCANELRAILERHDSSTRNTRDHEMKPRRARIGA
jgi:ferredoxin-nitrate reductase